MRKKITLGISLLAFILVGNSCSEYEMISYENDPALFFYKDNFSDKVKVGQSDSINHTFFFLPDDQKEDELTVLVCTMGKLADSDRPIKLIQKNKGEKDAAEAGIHYVAFDDPRVKDRMVIPAGKKEARIPIIILRDPSLDNKQVRLEMTLGTNEYFRPGILADDLYEFTIKTTTQTTKPAIWDTEVTFLAWAFIFGPTWGSNKMKFIVNATGMTDWEEPVSDIGYRNFLENTVRAAYQKHLINNGPLMETDNTPVQFKPSWNLN